MGDYKTTSRLDAKKHFHMIENILKNNLIPLNEYIFGTADLTGLIDNKFGEYKYGISIGKKLNDQIVNKIKNGPSLEYFEHYQSINKDLSHIAKLIQSKLKNEGINSIIIEPTISTSSKDFEKSLKTFFII